MLYAVSIGAISGGNYDILRAIFHTPMPNFDGRKGRDILLIEVFQAIGEIHDGFRLFPGLNRKHTPRSEHKRVDRYESGAFSA